MRLLIVLVLVGRAAAAAPVEDDAARGHYERGLAKYNIADFDAAIDEFKQSYELSKAPRLLFNIAQAYRLKKDWERALYFYNTYLRNDPKAPNREDVETRIDEMKQKLDAEAHAPPQPNGQQQPPPTGQAPAQPPPLLALPNDAHDRARGRRLEVAGLTTAAVGLAAAAVGGGLFGLASGDADKVRMLVAGGGVWDANAQHVYDEGTRSQTAAIALVAVGGAALTAGIVITAVGYRLRHRR